MKITLILLSAFICFAQTAPTIQWQKSLGGSSSDGANSISQTADGGFIVAGSSYSNDGDVSGNHGHFDYWVVKLNSLGDIEWQKCLGGSDYDVAFSISQTADSGFIVAGSSESTTGDVSGNHGESDYWVVKLNSSGDIVWQTSLGGTGTDDAYSISQAADGGFIVTGWSLSNDGDVSGNHGGWDYWVVKLNSSGDIQWQKSLGGTRNDGAYSISQTADGGFIVAGWSLSNDGDVSGNHDWKDYWVVKLNSSGDIVWQTSLGGTGTDGAYSISQTTDGGFIVAGNSNSNDGDVSGNHGYYDYWVVKLNSSGDIQWQKCLGGSYEDFARSISQTADGGFIVAGYSESNDGDVSGNNGYYDYWVVKLNSSGDTQWQKSLGGSEDDVALSISQTADGGFIVAGYSESNDSDVSGNHGGKDYWVVKLSPDPLSISDGNRGHKPLAYQISAYPNPFNSAVAICVGEGLKPSRIEIFDVNGRMVEKMSVGDGSPVPSSNGRGDLPPTEVVWQPSDNITSGVYLVRATAVGGESVSKRVVFLK